MKSSESRSTRTNFVSKFIEMKDNDSRKWESLPFVLYDNFLLRFLEILAGWNWIIQCFVFCEFQRINILQSLLVQSARIWIFWNNFFPFIRPCSDCEQSWKCLSCNSMILPYRIDLQYESPFTANLKPNPCHQTTYSRHLQDSTNWLNWGSNLGLPE